LITRSFKLLLLTIATAASFGCRHYAGWVERHVRVTPLNASDAAPATGRIELTVQREPGSGSLLIETARTESVRVRRELVARRTYAPYDWTAPVLKPFIFISLVGPFYMAYLDPHNHSGTTWGMGDYFRDVLGYINVFEALPNRPQRIDKEWKVLWQEYDTQTRSVPVPAPTGSRLAVLLGDQDVGAVAPNPKGATRFDLAANVTPELASADRTLTVRLLQGDKVLAEARTQLSKAALQDMLRTRL